MDIKVFEINAGNISAHLINYGAALTHLSIDDFDIVLGFDDPMEYVSVAAKGNPYFGCIVGRVANRYLSLILSTESRMELLSLTLQGFC